MKKELIVVFLVLCFSINLSATFAQVGYTDSIRTTHLIKHYQNYLKRKAFNQVDHFFIGGHIGLNVMFYHYDRVSNHQIEYSEIKVDLNTVLSPSLPTFRLFSGYQFKRHSFELGLENLQLQDYKSSPGYNLYYKTCPFTSVSYNIDLLYKNPNFKIFVGGQIGIIVIPNYIPANTFALPGVGANLMLSLPATKTTSFYFDTRFIIGLTPAVKGLSYNNITDGEYNRIFTLNFTLGCKFNMFTKKNHIVGLENMEQLKKEIDFEKFLQMKKNKRRI